MNILRVLAHTDWGADQKTLLKLYRSLVRSKLDYGCIVYGSARDSYIKELNPIHNQALRLCLGAFKSTRVESLYVETNEPPLEYRRYKLTMQYGIKIKANPDIPSFESIFPTDYEYRKCIKRNTPPPFRVRFQSLLDEAGIDIDDVASCDDLLDYPVWDSPAVECLSHLTTYNKENTPPYIFKQEYNIVKQEFHDHFFIYTDGSKMDEKVACAYVTKYGSIGVRLPDGISIFTAEAKAVELAIKAIKALPFSKQFMIFTDSLSLLQTIENQNLRNPIIGSILRNIHEIRKQDKEIRFCWIPSHTGIAGNDKADQAAKRALNDNIRPIKIPYTDKIPLIQKFLIDKWQRRWNQATEDKLREIKPVIGPAFIIQSSRKDQVVLNRIRLGCGRLSHSHLMERKSKPKCHFCNSYIRICIKHVILDCTFFSAIRSKFFSVNNMKELFDTVEVTNILEFLKETGLYNKI